MRLREVLCRRLHSFGTLAVIGVICVIKPALANEVRDIEIIQEVSFDSTLSARAREAIAEVFSKDLKRSFESTLDGLGVGLDGKMTFEASFSAATLDLGRAAPEALLVDAEIPGECGSGGCITHFLLPTSSGWRRAGESFGCSALVIVSTLSNGLRDVLATGCKSGDSYVHRYDGASYNEKDIQELSAEQAFAWMQFLANRGDIQQMFGLAGAYTSGNGAPRNNLQAYVWYARAAGMLGTPFAGAQLVREHARQRLKALILELSDQKIIEAERLARNWEPVDHGWRWFQ